MGSYKLPSYLQEWNSAPNSGQISLPALHLFRPWQPCASHWKPRLASTPWRAAVNLRLQAGPHQHYPPEANLKFTFLQVSQGTVRFPLWSALDYFWRLGHQPSLSCCILTTGIRDPGCPCDLQEASTKTSLSWRGQRGWKKCHPLGVS